MTTYIYFFFGRIRVLNLNSISIGLAVFIAPIKVTDRQTTLLGL